MSTKEDAAAAVTWCEFMQPDRTCAIMDALSTESNPLCKLWRDPPEDCRYLRLFVVKRKQRK